MAAKLIYDVVSDIMNQVCKNDNPRIVHYNSQQAVSHD